MSHELGKGIEPDMGAIILIRAFFFGTLGALEVAAGVLKGD